MSDRLNRSMALLDVKADVKIIKDRANDCWYDTKILANAVYLILEELTTAERKDEPQAETWSEEKNKAFYNYLWNVINPNDMDEYMTMFESQGSVPANGKEQT